MLQTAKLFARRGNNGGTSSRHMNGLTFGEFCVLAADLKRFRIQSSQQPMSSYHHDCISQNTSDLTNEPMSTTSTPVASSSSIEQNKHELKPTDGNNAPEVFLGGSCNPTTWRADVAMPTLKKLGISFYNPVSCYKTCSVLLINSFY